MILDSRDKTLVVLRRLFEADSARYFLGSVDAYWERTQAIRRICDQHGVDIRAAALQYPFRHPAVAAVIPGCRTREDVVQNLRFFEEPIPDAVWRNLDAAGLARAIPT